MKPLAARCKLHPAAAALALCLALTGFAASAGDDTGREISLRGFGTLGAVHSSEKNADFVSGFFEPNGAGHTRDWALGVDSKIGLQLDGRLSEKLSAVLQVVSQHRYDNTHTPQIEWANVKYQLTPDFDVRIGRTVTMPFMVSESRLVGYAHLWMRPPQEVYGLIPLTNKDGIDATYRFYMGNVTGGVHASFGQSSPKLPKSRSINAKRYFDIASTIEHGPATFRASYSTARLDLRVPSFDALVAGLAQFGNAVSPIPGLGPAGAQALALADKYRFEDARISVLALGARYDAERWLLMGEWAKFNGHSLLADSSAWYVTGGYRIRAFTPYVTLARLRADRRSEAGISTAGMPLPLATTAARFNAGLNSSLAGTTFAQKSIAAGVRWDFGKSTAVKLQYDRIDLDAGSRGRLDNVQPNFQPGGTVHVIGVAVDFVF